MGAGATRRARGSLCEQAVKGDEGQVSVLALGLAVISFAVAGLATDGTRAFLHRRMLQNAADSSVLAAASELDATTYYSSGGRRVVLDELAAQRVAAGWLARRGLRVRASVTVTRSGVTVALRDEIATTFLGLVGIRAVPVAVAASAEPRPMP
jgi:Flp pilus assembly protein TadG